jgi:nitroreductase
VRPSTWAFTTAVDDDALHRVLDVARFAPSGGNRQGWRLVVVRDPDARRRLRELYVPHWDAYPLVQNALLGLRAEVLGAAFATLPTPAEDDVRALLRIPAGIALAGHIGVGHRRDPWPEHLSRRPVAEFAFAEGLLRALACDAVTCA